MNLSLALYYIKRLNLYFAKENVGDIAEDLGLEYEEADLDEALREKHSKNLGCCQLGMWQLEIF